MIIFELLFEILLEGVFIDLIGGLFTMVNNSILKLRGLETKSLAKVKLDKLKRRYEYKTVKLKKNIDQFKKGTKGIVLELIDSKSAYVEFKDFDQNIIQIELKNILVTKNMN